MTDDGIVSSFWLLSEARFKWYHSSLPAGLFQSLLESFHLPSISIRSEFMLAFPWRCKRCLHSSSSFLGCSAGSVGLPCRTAVAAAFAFPEELQGFFALTRPFHAAWSFRATGGAPFHQARFSDCRIHQRIKIDFPHKSWKKSVLIHEETDSRSYSCPARVTCHISLYKECTSGYKKHRRITHCTVQRVDAAQLVSDEVSVFSKALQVPFAEKTY